MYKFPGITSITFCQICSVTTTMYWWIKLKGLCLPMFTTVKMALGTEVKLRYNPSWSTEDRRALSWRACSTSLSCRLKVIWGNENRLTQMNQYHQQEIVSNVIMFISLLLLCLFHYCYYVYFIISFDSIAPEKGRAYPSLTKAQRLLFIAQLVILSVEEVTPTQLRIRGNSL